MAQETTYLKLLQGSTTYSTNGTELKLSNGTNANQLIFNASSLQGKTWRLTSFTNESGSASVLPGTAITAVFGADGKVTGSAGCNNYFAGYQLSGNGIKIGPVGSTLMWCGQPPGVMAQETTYLKLLQGSTTYSTNGTELKLSNGTNANQLIFKAPVPCLMS
jgi:heat shock protein HslJ